MNIKINTRVRKKPEIAENILKNVSNDGNGLVAIKTIPNEFNGDKSDIPVNVSYVSSDGDIVKISKLTNTTLVEFDLDPKNIPEVIDEPSSKRTINTRTKIKFSGDEVELCKINYGYARKFFIHKVFNGVEIDSIIKYEPRNYKNEKNKTIYEGILTCVKENLDIAKDLISNVITDKTIVEWF